MTEPKTPRRRTLLKGAAVAAGAMSAPMVAVAQTTSLPLPEHLAGQGHLPRVRQRLRQEGQRHGRRPAEDRGAAGRRGGAGVPAARRGEQGHARRRPRRGRLPVRQELGARAVGLGPGLRHGPQHGARRGTTTAAARRCWRRSTRRSTWTCVSFLYGPMPTQPLGWFKKPVAKVEDMKGLKFRTVGLAVDIFTEMGAAVNPLPGGEIVPALDRGLIDAAEFNNAIERPRAGLPRRRQELHAAELPPVAASSSRSCSTSPSTTRCRRS